MSVNLDLVRSIYADWERQDYSRVDWADPEIEYVMAGGPDDGVWNGVQGMAEAFRSMLNAWSDWRVTPGDCVEVDAERVLVPYHFTARGRVSRLDAGQLRTRGATLFHLHAGRVTKIVQYFDRDRAFVDCGLKDSTMSQQNVEIVKRGIEAFNGRDVDLLAELTTPDFAWFRALPRAVGVGAYRGREGMETYISEVQGTWEELRIIIDERRDVGVGVLLLGRTEGRGRASGVDVNAPIGIAYDFRGHKISRCRAFLNHADALKAVGLEE